MSFLLWVKVYIIKSGNQKNSNVCVEKKVKKFSNKSIQDWSIIYLSSYQQIHYPIHFSYHYKIYLVLISFFQLIKRLSNKLSKKMIFFISYFKKTRFSNLILSWSYRKSYRKLMEKIRCLFFITWCEHCCQQLYYKNTIKKSKSFSITSNHCYIWNKRKINI